MKYTIAGASGNVARPLVLNLLKAGHDVTVMGRSPDHLKDLVNEGARQAIGNLEDAGFIRSAFMGSDAVFTMCPTVIDGDSIVSYCSALAYNYRAGIEANAISHVVNLSSIGAHLERGSGQILSMHKVEQILNSLENVRILHLRPAFFYTNLFAQIPLIKHAGMMGSNFSMTEGFPVVAPAEVATIAALELQELNFNGHSCRYIASDEISTDEIASIIGDAIGIPALKWI